MKQHLIDRLCTGIACSEPLDMYICGPPEIGSRLFCPIRSNSKKLVLTTDLRNLEDSAWLVFVQWSRVFISNNKTLSSKPDSQIRPARPEEPRLGRGISVLKNFVPVNPASWAFRWCETITYNTTYAAINSLLIQHYDSCACPKPIGLGSMIYVLPSFYI